MAIDWDKLASETSIQSYSAPETASYLNQDPKKLLDDPRFVEDVRRYFANQYKYYEDDNQMVEDWWKERNFAMTNVTFGTLGDLNRASSLSAEERERMKRLEQAYERMPMPWQDGGAADRVGGFETAAHIGMGLIMDPLNLIPISKAGQAARLGYLTTQGGKGVVRSAALKAGAQEAAAAGVMELGADALIQQRDMELGLQDEYSIGQGAMAATGGLAIGGMMGTALGALAAKSGVRFADQDLKALVDGYGLQRADLQKLTPEWLRKFQGNGGRLNHAAVREFMQSRHGDSWDQRMFKRNSMETMDSGRWSAYLKTLQQEVTELRRKAAKPGAAPETHEALQARLRDTRVAVANARFYQGTLQELNHALSRAEASGDQEAIKQAQEAIAQAKREHEQNLAELEGQQAEQPTQAEQPQAEAEQAQPEAEQAEAPEGEQAEAAEGEAAPEEPAPDAVEPERKYWNSVVDSDAEIFEAAGITPPAQISKRWWQAQAKKAGVEWDDNLSAGEMSERIMRGIKDTTESAARRTLAFEQAYQEAMYDFLENVQDSTVIKDDADLIAAFQKHIGDRNIEGFQGEGDQAEFGKRFTEALSKAKKDVEAENLSMKTVKNYQRDWVMNNGGEGPDIDIEGIAVEFDDPTVKRDVEKLTKAYESATRAGDEEAAKAAIVELRELSPNHAHQLLADRVAINMDDTTMAALKADERINAMNRWYYDNVEADVGSVFNKVEQDMLTNHTARILAELDRTFKDSGQLTYRGVTYKGPRAMEAVEMIVGPSIAEELHLSKSKAMGSYPKNTFERIEKAIEDMPEPDYNKALRAYQRSKAFTDAPVKAGEANVLATVDYSKLPDNVAHSKELALQRAAQHDDADIWFVNDQPDTLLSIQDGKKRKAPHGALVLMQKRRGAIVYVMDEGGKRTSPKMAPGFKKRSRTAKRGHPLPKMDGRQPTLPGEASMTQGDMPFGRSLAIRRKDNPLMVRPAFPNSPADFSGEKLLSFVDDPENWEVGHIDSRGAWSHTDPHKDPGRWMAAVDSFSNDFEPGNWSDRVEFTNVKPATIGDKLNTKVNLAEAFPDLEEFQARVLTVAGYGSNTRPLLRHISADGEMDFQMLRGLVTELERIDWDFSSAASQIDETIELLEPLYRLLDRASAHVPLGVIAKGRDEAVSALKNIYSDLSQAELKVLTDTMDRMAMASDGGFYPKFSKSHGDGVVAWTGSGERDGLVELSGQGQAYPRADIALHELGHWGFQTILTPAERLQFMRAVRQRLKGESGKELWELTGIGTRKMTDDNVEFSTNAAENINELFAEQFMLYARRQHAETMDASWWQTVAKKFKALVDRFIKGAEIEPAMVPLFERLLPTDEVIKARLINEGGVKVINPRDADSLVSWSGKAQRGKDGGVVHEDFNGIKAGQRLVELAQLRDRMLAGDAMDIFDISEVIGSLVNVNNPYKVLDGAKHGDRYLNVVLREKLDALNGVQDYRRGAMNDESLADYVEIHGKTPEDFYNLELMNPDNADSLPKLVDETMEVISWDLFKNHKVLVDGYTPIRFDTTVKRRGKKAENLLRSTIAEHQEGRAKRLLAQYDVDKKAMEEGTFDPALYRTEKYTPQEEAENALAKAMGEETPQSKQAKRRVKKAKQVKAAAAKEVASTKRKEKAAETRKTAQTDEAAEVATSRAGAKAPKAPTPVAEMVKAAKTDPTTLSLKALRKKVAELGNTKGGEGYARELVRRIRSSQARANGIAAHRLDIPEEISRKLERPLRDDLARALHEGKTERATVIENELRRRAAVRKAGEAKIGRGYVGDEVPAHLRPKVKSTPVVRAVAEEKAKAKGVSADGTSPNADVATRNAQDSLTHRDTEVAYDIRQVFSRLMSLAGTRRDTLAPQAMVERLIGERALGPVGKADMKPVDVSTEQFKKLRNTLRRVIATLHGKGGKSTDHEAMLDLAKMAIRAVTTNGQYVDLKRGARATSHPWLRAVKGEAPNAQNQVDWLAEQWQAYTQGKHKGDGLLPLFGEIDEAMALLTRGVIRGEGTAKAYGTVTRLGDVFDTRGTRDVMDLDGDNLPTSLALMAGEETLQRMPKDKLAEMAGWAGGPVRLLHTDAKMAPSDGLIGRAVYLSDEAGAVPLANVAEQLDKLPEGKRSLAVDALESMDRASENVADALRKLTFTNQPEVTTKLYDMVNDGKARIADAMATLKAMGVEPPMVANVVTNVKSTADLSSTIWYGGRSGLVRAFGKQLAALELATPKQFKEAFTAALNGKAKTMNGNDLHRFLLDYLEEFAESEGAPDALLREMLEDMGYDSLKLEDALAVFDPASVRRISDDFSAGETSSVLGTAKVMSQMTARLASGDEMDVGEVLRVLNAMEMNGQDKTSIDVWKKLLKNRSWDSLNEAEQRVFQRHSPFNWMAENSVRIRRLGMGWLADWIKPENGTGFFEGMDSEFAGALMPIIEKLEKLDGFNHWWQRAGYAVNPTRRGHQPQSMTRIVKALRYGSDETLSEPMEKEIYQQIKTAFEDEWTKMQEAGVVGERPIENYFPQIWDADKLRLNKGAFIKKLGEFFIRENVVTSGERITVQTALERAEYVFNRIVDNDADYYMGERFSSGVGGTESENISMMRVLRLHEFPQFLKDNGDDLGLESFMEDNLQAVLAKYFQGTTRQRMFHTKFGVNNHAVNDYFKVIGEGKAGAADLLRSGKVKRVPSPNMMGDSDSYVKEVRIWQPLARNPAHAMSLVNGAMEAMQREGNAKAGAEFLQSHLPEPKTPEAVRGNAEQSKRLEAIAHALWEFKGKSGALPKEAKDHALGTFMVMSGRNPYRGTPHFEGKWAASRFLRSVNSLTLLSYTMLTSFSDTVLPLVRSGNFSAWAKGIKKFAADPHYRKAMRNIGVSIENIAHQRMTQLYGVDSSRAANAFFNAVGLTPWTNAMREMSASVGFESFKAELARARTSTPGTQAYKNSRQYLRYYGLGNLIDSGRVLSDDDITGNKQIREALLKFTNESVFSPNANDIPVMARSPFGALVMQLKSFPLMMGRMAHRAVWDDAIKSRNIKPLLAMATALPAAGTASLAVKDYVQMRGGEDNREFDLATRNAGALPWVDADSLSDMDKKQQSALAWYFSGFVQAGGFGLIADMLISSTEQIDNGAYGQQRITGLIAGPWYDLTVSLPVNAMAGLMDDNEDSNAKERSGVRGVVGRIPLVGGNKAAREGITDWVAGEKQEKGGSASPFDADFGSDFDAEF